MTGPTDTGPLAFNTMRMSWADLPDSVRGRIVDLAGADVAHAHSTSTGFSPGFAGLLDLADGRRVFVKATGAAEHPWSIDLARAEIAANAALPTSAPAPRLLWSDDGDWALAAFELIDGETPALPWRTEDLESVLAAMTDLAHITPERGHSLPTFAEATSGLIGMWAAFAARPHADRQHAAQRGGPWGAWALRHLETLVEWESTAESLMQGDSLVHGDLRADNVLIDSHRKVWMVDWPYASVGAPWWDLMFFLPSVEMQKGGSAYDHFRLHPLGVDVPHETIRAGVTVMTAFFLLNSWEEPPEQIPTLREFQAGQAVPCVRWLQALEPSLT